MNYNIKNKIIQLGITVGLKKSDINLILNTSVTDQTSFSLGPPWYPGSRYGAVSIKEFKA